MQRIKILLLVLAVLLSAAGFSQDSLQQNKFTYFNTLSAGAAIGVTPLGTTATFSLVNGVRYGRMYGGIGIGFDDYLGQTSDGFGGQRVTRWNVMPVFFALGYDFAEVESNHFFLQLNTGYSQCWDKSVGYYQFSEIKGGVMVSPMIGYRVNPGNFNLSISAGYKWQTNSYRYGLEWIGGSRTDVKETMERLVIQIGIGLH